MANSGCRDEETRYASEASSDENDETKIVWWATAKAASGTGCEEANAYFWWSCEAHVAEETVNGIREVAISGCRDEEAGGSSTKGVDELCKWQTVARASLLAWVCTGHEIKAAHVERCIESNAATTAIVGIREVASSSTKYEGRRRNTEDSNYENGTATVIRRLDAMA